MLRNNADARRCSYLELGLPLIIIENLSHVRAQSTLDNREAVLCGLILLRNSFFVKQKNISHTWGFA